MKRVYLFAGHYGSGKTNIAVNLALQLAAQGKDVKIADLDVVNPYFRTKDSAEDLARAGVELISPAFANSNVDLPALPQEIYSLVQNTSFYAIMDIGGDERGALALGRYRPYILEENNYEMVFVANFFRPLTRTAEEAIEVMREIEGAGGIAFTAIVNNSNLGEETTAQDILSTEEEVNKLCALTGLPLLFTSVKESLAPRFDAQCIMPLKLQKKIID
ncbi:MAG: hypothetical protein IKE65_04405 [Clostridia bacterium]|nr:hypothetical protein [Clostridia bacterium]